MDDGDGRLGACVGVCVCESPKPHRKGKSIVSSSAAAPPPPPPPPSSSSSSLCRCVKRGVYVSVLYRTRTN